MNFLASIGTLGKMAGVSLTLIVLAYGVGKFQGHRDGVRTGFENGYERAAAACKGSGGTIEVEKDSWWKRRKKRKKILPFLSPVPMGFEGVGEDEPTEAELEPITEDAVGS